LCGQKTVKEFLGDVRVTRENGRMTKTQIDSAPENATGNQTSLASPFTDKRGYAGRWQGSTRWVDDLIARGMPHLKIGSRRVRICIADADAWMRTQFYVQRRAAKGVQ
jgi:hypothetical protein